MHSIVFLAGAYRHAKMKDSVDILNVLEMRLDLSWIEKTKGNLSFPRLQFCGIPQKL